MQWVPMAISLRVKRPWSEANTYRHLESKDWSHTSTLRGIYKDSSSFYCPVIQPLHIPTNCNAFLYEYVYTVIGIVFCCIHDSHWKPISQPSHLPLLICVKGRKPGARGDSTCVYKSNRLTENWLRLSRSIFGDGKEGILVTYRTIQ